MITLHGQTQDGKKLLLIGITDGHIALIKEEGGTRIVTPEGLVVDLMYAPTEQEMIAQLKQAGFINENTEVAVEKAPTIGKPSNIVKMDKRIITPQDDASNN